jgi:hypothetical protein
MCSRNLNSKQKIYAPEASFCASAYVEYYDDEQVIKLLSTGFLFTPDRIEFGKTLWKIYTSQCVPNLTTPTYPGTVCTNTIEPKILRTRRLDLPPLEVRYMDEDFCETSKINASCGDINAKWLTGEAMVKAPVLTAPGTCVPPVARQNISCPLTSTRGRVVDVSTSKPAATILKSEVASSCTPANLQPHPKVSVVAAEEKDCGCSVKQKELYTATHRDLNTCVNANFANCGESIGQNCNGPYTSKNNVPVDYANTLKMPYTTASVEASLNGSGNAMYTNQGVNYNPIVAGQPCRKYPAFTVCSVPDTARDQFLLTYTFYRDEFTVACPRVVTVSIPLMKMLLNNVRNSLQMVFESDMEVYESECQKYMNLIAASGLMTDGKPTIDVIIQAYIVWMFTYIGFVGGTRWDTCFTTTGTTSVPSNVPWIPVVNFDISLYDDLTKNFNDNLYNVDYLFSRRFLLYADVVLQAAYVVVDERFHRWCSVAAGGGWYVLMWNYDNSVEDNMYRHIYIIATLLCQELWVQKSAIKSIMVSNIARDMRLDALEKKQGVSVLKNC